MAALHRPDCPLIFNLIAFYRLPELDPTKSRTGDMKTYMKVGMKTIVAYNSRIRSRSTTTSVDEKCTKSL